MAAHSTLSASVVSAAAIIVNSSQYLGHLAILRRVVKAVGRDENPHALRAFLEA